MIKGYAMALGLRNCKIHPIRPDGQRPQSPLGGKHSALPPHPLMMARSPAGPRWARPLRVPRCPSDSATGAGSGAIGVDHRGGVPAAGDVAAALRALCGFAYVRTLRWLTRITEDTTILKLWCPL